MLIVSVYASSLCRKCARHILHPALVLNNKMNRKMGKIAIIIRCKIFALSSIITVV